MNKFLLTIVAVLFGIIPATAQRFSQYNTGTLYESFENPSVGIFKQDTSRQFAFNFLIPNAGAYVYLKGNSQYTLKSRLFLNKYDSQSLEIGQAKPNNFLATTNVYLLMFKAFTSLDGEQQLGFSIQTRANSRGMATDETVALLEGTDRFTANNYNNIFNDNAFFESYHQISATYREKVTKNFSLGFKVSGLLGIAYNKLDIRQSSVAFDADHQSSFLLLNGSYKTSFEAGQFKSGDIAPSFKNPGVSVSMGFSYKTADNFLIQGNVKDLGFIRWGGDARVYNFDGSTFVDYTDESSEKSTTTAVSDLVKRSAVVKPFVTPVIGRAELSGSRKFLLDPIVYTPTIIASKQIFDPYNGFTAALVNHVQYKNFIATITNSYDDNSVANFGGQLMYKSDQAEFYIGCEQMRQTLNFAGSIGGNTNYINKKIAYSGVDVFLGFSLKFGRVLEHPMNASYVPMGEEPGFLGRLWRSVFKKKPGTKGEI